MSLILSKNLTMLNSHGHNIGISWGFCHAKIANYLHLLL